MIERVTELFNKILDTTKNIYSLNQDIERNTIHMKRFKLFA